MSDVLVQPLEDLGRDLAGAPRPAGPRCRACAASAAAVSRSRRSASLTGVPSFADALSRAPSRSDTRRYGGASEICVLAEGDLIGADRLARDRRQHLLGHVHQLAVLAVGLVELEHRELGVVLRRDPFVPEVAVDLVDALDAADRQALQVELGRDAQEELHVERVVVRHERPRQRAAGDRLHHRRLDLEVAARVEEAADAGRAPGCAPRTPGASRD